MRCSFVSAALLALISSACAQTAGFDAISSPSQDQNITAGSSFDIIWEPSGVTGTITIKLLQGATFQTLEVGPVIASSIDNSLGKYTYTVPSTSSFATYGFEIVLDSTANSASPTFQYSFPFHIVDGSSSASGSSAPSSTGSVSTSVSASSTVTVHLSTGPNYTSSSATPTSTESIKVISTSTSSSATITSSSSSAASVASATTSMTSSSASASPTHNAAMANTASGGMAMIGGIVLALAF